MKVCLLALLVLPLALFSQKYALIDKNLKIPIVYTDSITVEQISRGFFPVQNKNIDTLVANLNFLVDMLAKQQRSKMQSFELRQASSIFSTVRVPYAYGDRYKSIATTTVNELTAKMLLINDQKSNKDNKKQLENLLNYIKGNKSFFKEPNEITPKLYEVVVITD